MRRPPQPAEQRAAAAEQQRRDVRSALLGGLAGSVVGAVIGALATLGGSWLQAAKVEKQIAAEERRHQDAEARRRHAVAIVMAADLTEITAAARSWRDLLQGPLLARAVGRSSISVQPLTRWSADDLALFPTAMLQTYGSLRLDVETFNANLTQATIEAGDDVGAAIAEAHRARLRERIEAVEMLAGRMNGMLLAIVQAAGR